MSNERIGVGMVGCGGIARWAHLPALARLAGVTLVGAADPDADARERVARWTPEVFADPAALLARSDVDAVVVAVPTHLHAEVAVAALEAGKHVYLEKPLAATREDARLIVAAADGSGAVLAIGLNRRAHPAYERARALLGDGRIGGLRAIQSVFCESAASDALPPWKRARATGGGVLADLGTHHADLVRWITGQEIVDGAGVVESRVTEEDVASVRWTTDGGVGVQSHFSYRAATADRMTLIGELGTLRVDRQRMSVELEVASPGAYRPRRRWTGLGLNHLPDRLAARAGLVREPSYRRALEAFVAGLRCAPPRAGPATAEDGLRALDAVEMVRP